ncbi:hypothetical protein EDB86DRAFT_2835419 [Lactarius hatsudake]|nr:hypothetical protein EDB86DRAFT_2835419 [Lactarius hatsudake]
MPRPEATDTDTRVSYQMHQQLVSLHYLKNQDKKKEKNKFSRLQLPEGGATGQTHISIWILRRPEQLIFLHPLLTAPFMSDLGMLPGCLGGSTFIFNAEYTFPSCPPPTTVAELQWGEPRLHAFGTGACVAGSISSGPVLLPLVSVGEEEGGAGQEWQACPSLSPYCGVMLDTYTLSVVVVGSCCPLWVTIGTHRLEVANLYLASGVGLGKRKAGQSGSGQSMELLWCNVPPDVLLAAQALGQTTA